MLGSLCEGEHLKAPSLLKRMAAEHQIPVQGLILSSPASSGGNVDGTLREATPGPNSARVMRKRARQAESAAQEQTRPERSLPDLPDDWQERLRATCMHNLESLS